MKKELLLSVAAATILSSGFTVCAAPQYMADGAIFDPEYYLEQNPDVAGWALGTSAEALYMHYTLHGASEGRAPYNAATLNLETVLPYQSADTTAPTQPTTPAQNATDPRVVYAIPGETYQFPSIHTEKYNHADNIVNISGTTYAYDEYDEVDYFPEVLEPYTLPGYEWKILELTFKVDGVRAPDEAYKNANMSAILDPYHDFVCFCFIDYLDQTTNSKALNEDIGDWITDMAHFTINQNGKDYTECKIFRQDCGGANEYYSYTWYALVPESFNGQLTIGYTGAKLENGNVVENESSPVILFNF